jgi:tetratricopeptide (TPR) repeat protein
VGHREGYRLLVKIEDKLTLPPFELDTMHGTDCPNSKVRKDMWLQEPNVDLALEVGFLTQLAQLCIEAKIRDCRNTVCTEKRKTMEKAAPPCNWKAFRDWALVAMSCQEAFSHKQQLSKAHTHLVNAVFGCFEILHNCITGVETRTSPHIFHRFLDGQKRATPIDLVGVCEIIFWMVYIQASMGLGPVTAGRWSHNFLPASITSPAIEKAVRKIPELKICKNRLWSLIDIAERKECDLPVFVNALESRQFLQHNKHGFCTPSKCQWAQMNSTQVEQLHKCANQKECKQSKFPVDSLEKALDLGNETAWSGTAPRLNKPNEPYIAISHVWSDGTGIGIQPHGSVNHCLFNYFAHVAKALGCDAVWWDTISIPSGSKAKSKALNQMHKNYANAACTVVHDQYLLDLEWIDHETACLALVLSPWFTRGWTALELAMSKRVKVLFGRPDSSVPVIKDLDDDILATRPSTASRAHWLASSLIRRLRTPIDNVGDLLAILRPRITSWVRDRTAIAGLIVRVPKCDYNRGESEITRDIIIHLGSIPRTCLLHGHPTMSESDGFSWCPSTLDDMPIDLSTDMRGDSEYKQDRMLAVDEKGVVTGKWWCRPITPYEIHKGRLQPYGNNLVTVVRVQTALRHWKNCMVLRDERMDNDGPALLVATVGLADEDGDFILDCRYIGAVRETSKGSRDEDGKYRGHDMTYLVFTVRIGNERGRDDVPAAGLYKTMQELPDDSSSELTEPTESDNSASEDSQLGEESDDEESKKQSASPGQTEDTPWYLQPDVLEYRQPSLVESTQAQDEYVPESNETKVTHLLSAIKRGDIGAARHLIKSGVDISAEKKHELETQLGADEWDMIMVLSAVYIEYEMPSKAEEMWLWAADRFYGTHGQERLPSLEAMYSIGRICLKLAQLDDAARMFQRVLELDWSDGFELNGSESKLRREFRHGAIAELCLLYADQMRLSEANETYKLAFRELGRCPSQTRTFTSADPPWGYPSAEQAKVEEHTYRTALRVFEKELGKNHALVLITAHNLAANYASQGDLDDAEELMKRVLVGLNEKAGPDHILTLQSSFDLGRLWQYQGKTSKAEEMYQRALQGFERKLGPENLLTVTTRAEHLRVCQRLEKET